MGEGDERFWQDTTRHFHDCDLFSVPDGLNIIGAVDPETESVVFIAKGDGRAFVLDEGEMPDRPPTESEQGE